jgi:hypothetical protein
LSDHFQNTVHIGQNIIVPKPQDAVVALLKPSIANPVLVAIGMLAAINLDNNSLVPANEIDDIAANRLLANELAAADGTRSQSIT